MSALYKVEIAPAAERQIKKLPLSVQHIIIKRLEQLKSEPRPNGVKKLSGNIQDFYRIRVGNYRVIYKIQDKIMLILIVKIGDRKDIYRM